MSQRAIIYLLFLSSLAVAFANLSCLDREGNAVPWFTLIKYPGNKTTGSPKYAYFDPNLGANYKIIYGSYADGKGEALPNTIAAINSVPEEHFNLLIFNDEPPNAPWDPYGGHAKGFIGFDNQTQTGVYVMHSFPKFPNVSAKGYVYDDFPSNTHMYGQNAYCISLNAESLGALMNNLPVEWPNVYYATGLFANMSVNSTEMHAVSQFTLLDGENQWYMTKSPNFTGFLYEDVIGPYFQTSLAVESWGRPYQDPKCNNNGSPYSYVNVDGITFNAQDTWDHYSDHSKWAIALQNNINLACLCDMNRMDTQEVRGGSCLCSQNQALYNALISIITVTDVCDPTISI